MVVVGDLVFCKADTTEKVFSDSFEPKFDYDDGEDNNSLPDVSNITLPEEKIQRVKIINSEDLIKGTYTFEDIVLPLPGSKIIYPDNEISELYHDMAKKDSISLIESVHTAKEFSITNMSGDYRRVFQRPIDYTWELLTYSDDNEDLADTDLDIMSGPKPTDLVTYNSPIAINSDDKINFVTEDRKGMIEQVESYYSDPKLALKLGFTLPASCYATMAIRELLKSSTSVAYQKAIKE